MLINPDWEPEATKERSRERGMACEEKAEESVR